ncbi:MAG: nucleotide exchange factor GrpE [Candidatus Bathyarchaeota archaeon]|jgi:molecular chaperone GrpE|nr:nucleotide exchange factor GrpE [Thermoproteota archaeon]MDT8782015.1 nucleotide exchange factor GrpE [Candidatus Bathyarchaeota archaeon]
MSDDKETKPVDFEKLLECEKKRSEDYLTRLKYLQADFENIKKRFERETEDIKKYCNERLIIQLLDVVDELELALKVAKSSNTPLKSLNEGVEMTLKKLIKLLEQEGVTIIECNEGKAFDPYCHNAITAETQKEIKTCTIIEVIRKGYRMKDKILRPTIVKVAKPSE